MKHFFTEIVFSPCRKIRRNAIPTLLYFFRYLLARPFAGWPGHKAKVKNRLHIQPPFNVRITSQFCSILLKIVYLNTLRISDRGLLTHCWFKINHWTEAKSKLNQSECIHFDKSYFVYFLWQFRLLFFTIPATWLKINHAFFDIMRSARMFFLIIIFWYRTPYKTACKLTKLQSICLKS